MSMEPSQGSRQQIMEAAERLFASHGYAQVKISEVCRISGLPVGSLYHHFNSKAGLLQAILERNSAEFFDSLPTVRQLTGDPFDRLEAYYQAAARLIEERLPMFRLFVSLRLHEAGNDELQAIVRDQEEAAITRMTAFIEPVVQHYGIRDAAYSRELAALTIAFTSGLVVHSTSTGIGIRAGMRHVHQMILSSILDRAERTTV